MSRLPRQPARVPEPRRESKVCSICRENKPLTEFYRRPTGGASASCKPCADQRSAENQRKLRRARGIREVTLQPKELPDGMRFCTACRQTLTLDQFEARKRGGYKSVCRECRKRESAEYKAAKREQVKASNARYREQRREELRERQRAWREEHPERYSAIHSKWKKANPDAMRASANKRRVLVEQQEAHYTAAEWRALKAFYDYRCLMCGKREPEIHLTPDHIIPIALGGKNTIENLQPLCGGRRGRRSCNSVKHLQILDLRPLTQAAFQL